MKLSINGFGTPGGIIYESPYVPLLDAVKFGRPFIHYIVHYSDSGWHNIIEPSKYAHKTIEISGVAYPQGNFIISRDPTNIIEKKTVVLHTSTKTPQAVLREVFSKTDGDYLYGKVVCNQEGHLTYRLVTFPPGIASQKDACGIPKLAMDSPLMIFHTNKAEITGTTKIILTIIEYEYSDKKKGVDVSHVRADLQSDVKNAEHMHECIRINYPYKKSTTEPPPSKKRRVNAEALLLY